MRYSLHGDSETMALAVHSILSFGGTLIVKICRPASHSPKASDDRALSPRIIKLKVLSNSSSAFRSSIWLHTDRGSSYAKPRDLEYELLTSSDHTGLS